MHTINDPAKVTHVVLVNKKSFTVKPGTFQQEGDVYTFDYRRPGGYNEFCHQSVRADFVASISEDV